MLSLVCSRKHHDPVLKRQEVRLAKFRVASGVCIVVNSGQKHPKAAVKSPLVPT